MAFRAERPDVGEPESGQRQQSEPYRQQAPGSTALVHRHPLMNDPPAELAPERRGRNRAFMAQALAQRKQVRVRSEQEPIVLARLAHGRPRMLEVLFRLRARRNARSAAATLPRPLSILARTKGARQFVGSLRSAS